MCVGDYKIGRLITSNIFQFNATQTDQVVLPPNRNRVGFTVGGNSSASLFLAFETSPANGNNYNISSFGGHAYYSLLLHGNLVTKEVHLTSSSPSTDVQIVEFILPEAALEAAGITWP